MGKITRKNLVSTLNELETVKTELEGKKYEFKVNRTWPGFRMISSIDDPEHLVDLWISMHASIKSVNEAVDALDMRDMLEMEENNFYGYSVGDWESDMKVAAQKIKDANKLKNILSAIKILKRNMSDDDKFNADMESVANLLA